MEHQREKRRKVLHGLSELEVTERIKLVGTAKVFKWPTRLGKKLHLAGSDLALREMAEKSWEGSVACRVERADEEGTATGCPQVHRGVPHDEDRQRKATEHVEEACQDVAKGGPMA